MRENQPYEPGEPESPYTGEGNPGEGNPNEGNPREGNPGEGNPGEGNPAEECSSAEAREIAGENPEAPTGDDEDIGPVTEKSEAELLAERLERQDVADEQAESIRRAEEELQKELAKQGAEPVVNIRGLRKAFGEHEVLRGVDLHVNKGENLVILGKSGTGKSVLIKCLVGLEWPDEGEICVFGKDVSRLNYAELNESRLRTGFLFQNAALYDSMTVRENLLFPLRQHKKDMTREKKQALIMEMLDNVGLAESMDQLPSRLSGGQSKRIGLARTLILRPELMLYDEPTTGLDTGTGKEISELMIRMKKKYNISSITITHDMPCAKMTADRIIMLREGVVVAEGTYEELERSEDEWIRSFFH
ncbi:MAG TPA: ATP-binding cassette domain-containing protein [Puia sp.]|nr:ATP-binding cassette domain-containing protein [Puia sp.]